MTESIQRARVSIAIRIILTQNRPDCSGPRALLLLPLAVPLYCAGALSPAISAATLSTNRSSSTT